MSPKMSQALRRSTYAQIRAEDIGKLISEIGQMTNTTNNRWELDIYQSAIDCFYAGQLHLERAAKIARATAEEEEAQRDKDFEQCSDGSTYKEQIYRNGKLEIIR